jgi:hypothetical protein
VQSVSANTSLVYASVSVPPLVPPEADQSGQRHRYLPVSSVASVSGGQVRLYMPHERALVTITGELQPSLGMGSIRGG